MDAFPHYKGIIRTCLNAPWTPAPWAQTAAHRNAIDPRWKQPQGSPPRRPPRENYRGADGDKPRVGKTHGICLLITMELLEALLRTTATHKAREV